MLRAGCHPTFGSGSGRGVSNVVVSIVRAPRLGNRSAIPSAKGLRSRCTCTHGRCWRCSREHRAPLRAGEPGTVPIPKPGCCKAPGPPARTPALPDGPPLRSQQSGRTAMCSIALPQAAPSQGSQSQRVGHTARGSTRLRDRNKCRTGDLRLLSPAWLCSEASVDTERRDQHTRAPQKPAAGTFGRRTPKASACCRAPDSRVLQRGRNPGADPTGLRADSMNAKPCTAGTELQTQAPSLQCAHAVL